MLVGLAERGLNISNSLGGWGWAERTASRELSRVWDDEAVVGCPVSVFRAGQLTDASGKETAKLPRERLRREAGVR